MQFSTSVLVLASVLRKIKKNGKYDLCSEPKERWSSDRRRPLRDRSTHKHITMLYFYFQWTNIDYITRRMSDEIWWRLLNGPIEKRGRTALLDLLTGSSDWFFLSGVEKCVRVNGHAELGLLERIRRPATGSSCTDTRRCRSAWSCYAADTRMICTKFRRLIGGEKRFSPCSEGGRSMLINSDAAYYRSSTKASIALIREAQTPLITANWLSTALRLLIVLD